MNKVHELICIVCPKGCHLHVDDDLNVTGHGCPRGIVYGKAELLNPTRLVSSTVKLVSADLSRLPVVTSGEVPKGKIFEVMEVINGLTITAPVTLRQVLVKNILGLGVDLIATRSVKR
jgi:CxxC motif-containing protein